MKTISLTLLAILFVCSLPLDLRAMGGRIDSPILVIPKPVKPGGPLLIAPTDKHHTLVFKDFQKAFVDGYFINSLNWLYFAGDTDTLNRMLKELSETPGARFEVRFTSKPIGISVPFQKKTDPLPTSDAHWMIQYDNRTVNISVFLGPGGISLEKLDLPAMTGTGNDLKGYTDEKN